MKRNHPDSQEPSHTENPHLRANADGWSPATYQPALPLARLIQNETPRGDVALDVVFVGAGPAGLAGAIALARMARDAGPGSRLRGLEIGVLEKSEELGDHCLSGAILNPISLRALFPELSDRQLPLHAPVRHERVYWLSERARLRVPAPPSMRNRGNFVISICELVRWLGQRADELGVHLLTGFPGASLLVDGDRVLGVRTAPAGLHRDGTRGPSYLPASDVSARVTVLAEGARGPLTQAWLRWQGIGSANPQIFALGIKELWRTPRPLDAVVHTLGWPLPNDVFGGSFAYPLESDALALGLVVGLDYPEASIDPHERLQALKSHPLLRRHLADGQLLEWGAKVIPEGGFYSLPERVSGNGALLVGDAAGFVDVPSLKGIHYAIESGRLAARAIADAIERKACDAIDLRRYDEMVRESFIWSDLERSRNMRLAFTRGFWPGAALAGAMTLTRGRFPGARIAVQADAEVLRRAARRTQRAPRTPAIPYLSKVEGVYLSGNDTRDDMPSHLLAPEQVPEALGRFYASMCPAGVYEWMDGRLVVSAPNCVDCKTTDVLGPRWLPREGGSGPKYRRM